MRRSVEFIAGLLAQPGPPLASFDDLNGPHREALWLWQRIGFLSTDPEPLRVPSCPHDDGGTPVRLGERLVCGRCFSAIDSGHLLAWRFDLDAFLSWLTRELLLDGDVRHVDENFWQLGTATDGGEATELFFCRSDLMDQGRARLSAYRRCLAVTPLRLLDANALPVPKTSLVDILVMSGDSLSAALPNRPAGGSEIVRFDAATGALWVAERLAGEVALGSKEFCLMACLAEHRDAFVSYAELKHEILRRSGSRDTTEEATFCQKLKSRIKKKWIPEIDRLVMTTNKGDGYRLRCRVEL